MKKKLIAIMLVFGAALGTAAHAENSITARTEDNSVVFEKQEGSEDSNVVLSFYNKEGKLEYSNICTLENNEYRTKITDRVKDMRVRACFLESGKIYDVELKEVLPTGTPVITQVPTEATQEPLVTEIPLATQEPSATQIPNDLGYPSVYKSAAAAKNAFAVVEGVASSAVGGEDKYLVNVLYQGTQKTLEVDSELRIAAASDYYSSLEGQKMTALKKGDVICFTYNLSKTKIKQIGFVTRPVKEETALSEEDFGKGFQRLISANGRVSGNKDWGVVNYNASLRDEYSYAFGIITDRSGTTMTVYPQSGNSSEALDIDLDKGTIVYTCDTEEKNKLEVTGLGGITKTAVPKRAYDEKDNISFTSEYKYSYALVRLVDGTATDIIVYK